MRGSRNKFQGGGGGGGFRPGGQKTVWTKFFFQSSTYFTAYIGGPMVLLQRKLYFSKDLEGVQHFSGRGGPTFSRGGGGYKY